MAYLLDANVFIQAKNLHYGLDFCPAFWDWLVARNAAGEVFSIERVGDEIEAGADELADWAADRGSGFFLKPDTPILTALPRVSAWVTGQRYEPAASNTFLQVADYYLVGHALAHGHTVVTPTSGEKARHIVAEVEGIGAEPFHSPDPLPPIEKEEIRLITWMAMERENAEGDAGYVSGRRTRTNEAQ